MNHLSLIIKREYITKIKNKSFIIMTVLSPLIMVLLFSVVAYLSQLNNDKLRVISVLDESGLLQGVFENSEKTTYHILENISLETAKDLVKKTANYGLLHVEQESGLNLSSKHIKFYSEESPSLSLITNLESKISKRLTNLKLQKTGVDINVIEASKTKITIAQETFLGKETSKTDSVVKLIFGSIAGYLLFMFIIIYGNMIMRSVIEEKTNRIIEVIISSVKPLQLMLGKIIGTTLAGITQFAIWIVLGGILIIIISVLFNVEITPMLELEQNVTQQALVGSELNTEIQDIIRAFYNLPIANLVIAFILFFTAGYLLYSSFYAAIGAAVDNETDTQQFIFPVLMPLMLSVYVGAFTVIEDPHGVVSTVFSYIPFTSPVVMLMRIPFGVPLWQQLVSLLLLIATFMLTIWFAAKIYKVGILMYGKKPNYKELIKWLKY